VTAMSTKTAHTPTAGPWGEREDAPSKDVACNHNWRLDPLSYGLIDVCANCGEERA